MANTNLFGSSGRGKMPRKVEVDEEGEPFRNEAGGVAFAHTPKHALAQYACTGTLSNTFYASDRDQLKKTLELVSKVDDAEFIGKLAVYARKQAFMKDMPALLVAVLFARSSPKFLASDSSVPGIKKLGYAVEASQYRQVFKTVFPVVINNAKMLRNFVQIITSGVLGRKSFGRVGLKAMQEWFASRNANQIFRSSIGQNPSMADIIKLAHPKGETPEKDALYAYLIGAPTQEASDEKRKGRGAYAKPDNLPQLVKDFEAFKKDTSLPTPKVDFRMLTALELSTAKWREIALNGRWHFVRMNLNTFQRHGVFEGVKGAEIADELASLLCSEEEISKAMVFPYQLLAAYLNAGDIPMILKLALQEAMEIATQNVPTLPGNTVVFPDVSGSMSSPVTGHRKGATTKMTCLDIAALVSASILRTSPLAQVIPVDTRLHTEVCLNPRDSVVTNTDKLRIHGMGTNLSLGMEYLVQTKAKVDTIIFVTDSESWADKPHYWGARNTTGSEANWQQIRAMNPGAKLVNIQIQPYGHTQVKDGDGVLNIGGFSDQVFEVISRFVEGTNPNYWVEEIEKVSLA